MSSPFPKTRGIPLRTAQLTSSLYALDLGHLERGPSHTFSHPRLRCDTFYIKVAVKDDLIATGSSDAAVLLTSSNPTDWRKGAVALRGGHSKEVSDVSFSFGGDEVCSISDDMSARVWRNGTGVLGNAGEKGCGCGWAEI